VGTDDRYMSAEQAARKLGVSKRAVRDMVASGKLRARRDGEGAAARLMVSVASVRELLARPRGNGR
jgi:excisionase family DNA binding protein